MGNFFGGGKAVKNPNGGSEKNTMEIPKKRKWDRALETGSEKEGSIVRKRLVTTGAESNHKKYQLEKKTTGWGRG